MDGISFKTALNYFVEPVQKQLLFTLTKQQKIIGALALALFALITLTGYLYKKFVVESVPINENPGLGPAMPLVGIPNLGSTCYINSAVMSLYPLRGHLFHLNSPPLKAIIEVYDNPVQKAPELVSILKHSFDLFSERGGGDCCHLISRLLEKILEEDPALENLFCGFLNNFTCGPCNQTKRGGEISEFCHFGSDPFTFDKYLCCPLCDGMCGMDEDIKLPKYCFVNLSNSNGMVLEENLQWHGIEFKVISALKGGTGH
jgi:hypothetical protein